MKLWVLGIVLMLACSCATITTQRVGTTPLAPTETLYAWFEFDRINLADTFHAAFREQGLRVASSKHEADILLTGAYSATYDLIHYRFDWAQLKLLRPRTGETIFTIQTGQGGAESTESVVKKMVEHIKQLF